MYFPLYIIDLSKNATNFLNGVEDAISYIHITNIKNQNFYILGTCIFVIMIIKQTFNLNIETNH